MNVWNILQLCLDRENSEVHTLKVTFFYACFGRCPCQEIRKRARLFLFCDFMSSPFTSVSESTRNALTDWYLPKLPSTPPTSPRVPIFLHGPLDRLICVMARPICVMVFIRFINNNREPMNIKLSTNVCYQTVNQPVAHHQRCVQPSRCRVGGYHTYPRSDGHSHQPCYVPQEKAEGAGLQHSPPSHRRKGQDWRRQRTCRRGTLHSRPNEWRMCQWR